MKLKRVLDEKGLVSHVEVLSGGDAQRFSPRVVEKGLMEGWMSIGQDSITIKAKPTDMVYSIKCQPGVYCCHCQELLAGGGEMAMEHIRLSHPGAVSPDSCNRAGYRYDNFYECRKGG